MTLARDGKTLSFKEINERNIHAEVITRFIDELMTSASFHYDQLDAIAVSSGPGSYTGLRIGISTAKGLCFALDKPLIAIETLEAMALGMISKNKEDLSDDTLLCPMIDARRMEVYTAIFRADGSRVTATTAEIIDENSFSKFLENNKVLFFGDGAEKCEGVLSKNNNAHFVIDFTNSASFLTEAANQKFESKAFEDVAYFEPFYLKEFIAGKKAL